MISLAATTARALSMTLTGDDRCKGDVLVLVSRCDEAPGDGRDNCNPNDGNGGKLKVGGSRSTPLLPPPRRDCKKAAARKFMVVTTSSSSSLLVVGNNGVNPFSDDDGDDGAVAGSFVMVFPCLCECLGER